MLQKHCINLGSPLYLSPSEDTTGPEQHQLSLEERVIIAGMKPTNTEKLERKVEIMVRMKVMVVINIATEVDLANGTCGKVAELILDP